MNIKKDFYTIKFNNFEGTTIDLIKSIKENKLNIDDVPIVEIINDYIDILEERKESIDINGISKIINHTALLLKIKSEELLPKNPLEDKQEEDEEEQDLYDEKGRIVDIYIQEYEKYKKVINYLKEKAEKQKNVFFPTADLNIEEDQIIIEKVDLSDLLMALEKILSVQKNKEYIPIKKRFFTVAEKMKIISQSLKENRKGLSFVFFMKNAKSKLEIIIIFLALLQLIHLKKISCFQKKNYDNIIFKLREVH